MVGGNIGARIPVLHGFTAEGNCTLCQLVKVEEPGLTEIPGQSITASTYQAGVCVTGMYLGGLDDKCLTSARFTFTGLSEWLPRAATETWNQDIVMLEVPLNVQELFSFSLLDNRARVSLNLSSELATSEVGSARICRSVAYVQIETPGGESLSWYLALGNRLENLFSLILGTSLALETMFVYCGEENGHVIQKRNNYGKPFKPFECVRCTHSQLATSIAIWLSESPQFRSVENLALGVLRKGQLFLETEFLSLAQALEGFHRVTACTTVPKGAEFRRIRKKIVTVLTQENIDQCLIEKICSSLSHVNDPTFASRLAELCSRISPSVLVQMEIDPVPFVADIVVTRNFYTHAGGRQAPRGKKSPPSLNELFFLNKKMRSLLRGLLLLHLRIPEEQFSALLVREVTKWR